MPKLVVFCADGTWNGPGDDDESEEVACATNVYKMFAGLEGEPSPGSIRLADEQEKELRQNGAPAQVAKYIHGVGDSRNPIGRLLGGAFGAGLILRIVRGYTFISRSYEPGDEIVLVGFSRGAYTARALAGLILSQGLLSKALTEDPIVAYRFGAKAWYAYRREGSRTDALARLEEAAADLPAFLSSGMLSQSDCVPVRKLKAVAVWDTVGALGIPRYIGGGRADAFRFCDEKLSPGVERGLHAIALDERRIDFVPTLWEPAANATQVAFAGAHADVGGGYPAHESGLSDISLRWMADELAKLGVRFKTELYRPFDPDRRGIAHKPWKHLPFNREPDKARALSDRGIGEHASVAARMNAGPVVQEPGESPAPYAPENRP